MRAWRNDCRSAAWKNESGNQHTVKILGYYGTSDEAHAAEQLLIKHNFYDLVNIHKDTPLPHVLDFKTLNENFVIDKNSPSFLSCKVSGRPVGQKGDYWIYKDANKFYKVHRIIYVLANGGLDPKLIVDHINRDRYDNNPLNLRAITIKENSNNLSLRHDNTSGEQGIYSVLVRDKYKSWCCAWYEEGKKHEKWFSCLKYGDEVAKQMAIDYRKAKLNNI